VYFKARHGMKISLVSVIVAVDLLWKEGKTCALTLILAGMAR
jgi:hypothetical protein